MAISDTTDDVLHQRPRVTNADIPDEPVEMIRFIAKMDQLHEKISGKMSLYQSGQWLGDDAWFERCEKAKRQIARVATKARLRLVVMDTRAEVKARADLVDRTLADGGQARDVLAFVLDALTDDNKSLGAFKREAQDRIELISEARRNDRRRNHEHSMRGQAQREALLALIAEKAPDLVEEAYSRCRDAVAAVDASLAQVKDDEEVEEAAMPSVG